MRRVHLFEIHEQAWLPDSLRDVVTDILQWILNLTKTYAAVEPRLRAALKQSMASQIVDLCSVRADRGCGCKSDWQRRKRQSTCGLPISIRMRPHCERSRRERAAGRDIICRLWRQLGFPAIWKGFEPCSQRFITFRQKKRELWFNRLLSIERVLPSLKCQGGAS